MTKNITPTDQFEIMVIKERTRIAPIIAACNLSGEWGNFYGVPSYEFLVNGDTPDRCPNCNGHLTEQESTDSTDWNITLWLCCNPCGLIWYNNSFRT